MIESLDSNSPFEDRPTAADGMPNTGPGASSHDSDKPAHDDVGGQRPADGPASSPSSEKDRGSVTGDSSSSGQSGSDDGSTKPASAPLGSIQTQMLESSIVEVLKTIYDPEIPVNIYELGLIYGIDVDLEGKVTVRMTLTSPACPVAGSLVTQVEYRVASIDGVDDAHVDLVWDPPWTPDRMSEAARLQLNL